MVLGARFLTRAVWEWSLGPGITPGRLGQMWSTWRLQRLLGAMNHRALTSVCGSVVTAATGILADWYTGILSDWYTGGLVYWFS